MANTSNLSNFLTDVADSIRAKKGTENKITPANFDTEIDSIAEDTTATTNDILSTKTAYIDGSKQIGTMPNRGAEVITPGSTMQQISEGYHNGEGYVEAVPTESKTVKSTTTPQTINPTSGKYINEITVNPIVLEEKTVVPTTSSQTITPTSGKDGISQINVSAVTSSIDSNIQAGNIKSGTTILGVEGTVIEKNGQNKTINPSTSEQVITPDSQYNALNQVTVNAIQTESKTVKSTTQSQIITPTTGKFISEITVSPIDLENKTVTPTTSSQTINPSTGKDGINQISVGAVTSSIDSNIKAENIKNGVEILGIIGTLSGSEDLSTELSAQDTALSSQESKIEDIQTALANKYVVPSQINLQTKSMTVDTNGSFIITPDTGYDGIGRLDLTVTTASDWSEIGYSTTPTYIQSGYYYAKQIYDNWDATVTNLDNEFENDADLRFIPLVDMSNVTSMDSTFKNCKKIVDIPYLNTNNVTVFDFAFANCESLEEIDFTRTRSAVSMVEMFSGCINLKHIYSLSIDNIIDVAGLHNIFANCPSLDDESLNIILQICAGAHNIATTTSSNKTLKYLGLSQVQATKCQSFGAYSFFEYMGWSTGY